MKHTTTYNKYSSNIYIVPSNVVTTVSQDMLKVLLGDWFVQIPSFLQEQIQPPNVGQAQ